MFSRRKVLGGMAGGAAAASMGSVSGYAQKAILPPPASLGAGIVSGSASNGPSTLDPQIIARVVAQLGGKLPDWKRDELWEDTNYYEIRDQNLLSMRSVSPAAKVMIGRERMFKIKERDFWNTWTNNGAGGWRSARDRWFKNLGIPIYF